MANSHELPPTIPVEVDVEGPTGGHGEGVGQHAEDVPTGRFQHDRDIYLAPTWDFQGFSIPGPKP